MKTIECLEDLRVSQFGRPNPRHGLELLHWFSCDYINMDVNGHKKPKLDLPQSGAFGFRLFYNYEKILPKQNLPYYEVGNLHGPGSDQLPLYVRQKYTHSYDGSNKDRIIISMNESRIEKVYVTEHIDQRNFNRTRTYQVSQRVIEQIRRMKRKQFLKLMQQQWPVNDNQIEPISQMCTIEMFDDEHDQPSYINPDRGNSRCWCTIL